MTERLTYEQVRAVAGRVNRLAGWSANGSPIRKRREWIPNALTVENSGYGHWSVARITNTRGGCSDVFRGKLRECDAFLRGMELTLTEGKNDD